MKPSHASNISLNEIESLKNLSFYDIENGLKDFHICNPSKTLLPPRDPKLIQQNKKELDQLIDFIYSTLNGSSTSSNGSTYQLKQKNQIQNIDISKRNYSFRPLKIIAENPELFSCDYSQKKSSTFFSRIKIHFEQVVFFKFGSEKLIEIPVEGSRVIIELNEFGKIDDVRFVKIYKYPLIDLKNYSIDLKSLMEALKQSISKNLTNILTSTEPLLDLNFKKFLEIGKELQKLNKQDQIYGLISRLQKQNIQNPLYIYARPSINEGVYNYFLRLHSPFGLHQLIELGIDFDTQEFFFSGSQSNMSHLSPSATTTESINNQNQNQNQNLIQNQNNKEVQLKSSLHQTPIFVQNASLKNIVNKMNLNSFFKFSNAPQDSTPVDIESQIEKSFRAILIYFENEHSYMSYDNQNSPLNILYNVDLFDLSENAAWVKSPVQKIFIGSTSVQKPETNKDPTSIYKSIDILAHEFFHGIQEVQNPLINENESGALSEHLSDMMGIAARVASYNLGVYTSPISSPPTFSMASNGNSQVPTEAQNLDLNLNQELKIGTLLENPVRDFIYPEKSSSNIYTQKSDADRLIGFFCQPTSDNDYCGVHIQSGIPSVAIANSIQKIARNFEQRKIANANKKAVMSISKLIFKVALNDLSGAPTFKEYGTQLLRECKNPDTFIKHGLTLEDCEVLNDEFRKVGILK